MNKISLTLFTLFLSMSYSVTVFAHPGHSHDSVSNLLLHIVLTISVYLALLTLGVLLIKRFPNLIKKRAKK